MTPSKATVGSMLFLSDMRQIGALLMPSLLPPTLRLSSDPTEQAPPRVSPCLLYLVDCSSCRSVFLRLAGYNQVVHDRRNKHLTGALMIPTRTASILLRPIWLTLARVPVPARPLSRRNTRTHRITHTQVKFVGAMGMLGIVAYDFTFGGYGPVPATFSLSKCHVCWMVPPGDTCRLSTLVSYSVGPTRARAAHTINFGISLA
jgi:hypothetical protein